MSIIFLNLLTVHACVQSLVYLVRSFTSFPSEKEYFTILLTKHIPAVPQCAPYDVITSLHLPFIIMIIVESEIDCHYAAYVEKSNKKYTDSISLGLARSLIYPANDDRYNNYGQTTYSDGP